MSSLRANGYVIVLTAIAASCWDGALDPVYGAPDGGDADIDTDSETETDSETVVDTDPVPCSFDVVIYIDNGEYYEAYCDFTLAGVCQSDSSECVGCAWQNAEEDLCDGSGVCCVEETSFATCEPYVWWFPTSLCGYFEGSCPEGTVSLASMDGQPACQGGEFCCYPVDGK